MEKQTKPVIVTALFDIERDTWDNYNMSYDTYLHWMYNMLKIDNPMVIYTEEKFFKRIYGMRSEFDPKMNKTKIIVQEKEALPAYKLFYTRLKNLMESQAFKEIYSFDVPEMTKPLYNVIMFNKLYFLRHARDSRFFDNTFTLWVDAGCYREDICGDGDVRWPNKDRLDLRKPTYFSHHDTINIHNIYDHALSQMRFIHGTCFGVPNDTLDDLIISMETTIDDLLKMGYIGSDEKIFDIMVLKDPSLYKLIKCGWREYFDFFS